MSLQTWKAEFYPVPASKCPIEEAVEHSLRKWQGLRHEALSRHGLELCHGVVSHGIGADYRGLGIESESCALCVHYFNWREDDCDCEACPIKKHLGLRCDEGENSPYEIFLDTNDPEPMIAALEAAKRLEEARPKETAK